MPPGLAGAAVRSPRGDGLANFAEQFQSQILLSQDDGPGTAMASEAPARAVRAKRQVLPSVSETGSPTATLAETAAAHVSGVTLQATPGPERPPMAEAQPQPVADAQPQPQPQPVADAQPQPQPQPQLQLQPVADEVAPVKVASAATAFVPTPAIKQPGPAPATAVVEPDADPLVERAGAVELAEVVELAGEVESAEVAELALASALNPPLSGPFVSAAAPPPGAQGTGSALALAAMPEARGATAALPSLPTVAEPIPPAPAVENQPALPPAPGTTPVAHAVQLAGAASVVRSDVAAPVRQRAAPPAASSSSSSSSLARSFEAGAPLATGLVVEPTRSDTLASAERLQALLVDAGQETWAVRPEAGGPVLVNAPVVFEARAQRADVALAPGTPASDVVMAEAGQPLAQGADDLGSRPEPSEAEGLHMDLRLDGNGRALVIVRTNDDALGRSLRDSTDQLQAALDDFGLRVEVDIRQGHDRSGASFSQREHSFHERPGARAPAARASRSDSPAPLPRVQTGGLSLSVYA